MSKEIVHLGDSAPRHVALCIKTTGRSISGGDRVIEIGAVEIKDRRLGREWSSYCNPEGQGSDFKSLVTHQLTDDFLAEQPLFSGVHRDFLSFIKGATLIIFNKDYDLGFLDAELRQCSKHPALGQSHQILDILELQQKLYPGSRSTKLSKLARQYDVPESSPVPGALIDARLLAKVYLSMTASPESMTDAQKDLYELKRASLPIAYLLWLLLGLPGVHRIYAQGPWKLMPPIVFVFSVNLVLRQPPPFLDQLPQWAWASLLLPSLLIWLLDLRKVRRWVTEKNRKIAREILA